MMFVNDERTLHVVSGRSGSYDQWVIRAIILLWFVPCITMAQTITFSKTFDFNGGLEIPISVVITNEGYVIAGTGSDYSSNAGWIGTTIFFVDLFGVILNKKYYGKPAVNYNEFMQTSFKKL
jgi:hypothetical protein